MSLTVLLSALASATLLFPANMVLLCAVGCLLYRRGKTRAGGILIGIGLALLLVMSTRVGAMWLVRPLENQYPAVNAAAASQAQAIVILGANRLQGSPELGERDQNSLIGLKRVEYGAQLQRQTGLPVLLTGGQPDGSADSEAALMAHSLREDFHGQARWLEEHSRTTYENAIFSAKLLKRDGIRRVLVVTDAIHMPRAMQAFAATGLEATAAPMLFQSHRRPMLADYLPGAANLQLSSYALREWIGQWWYRLRYR